MYGASVLMIACTFRLNIIDPGAHESSLPVAHPGYQVLSNILFRLGLIPNALNTYIKKLQRGKDIKDATDYLSRINIVPKTVIINVGTNSLARENGFSAAKAGIFTLLSTARTKFQHAKILLCPILPRTYDTSFNNDARKLNAETKRCCEKMDNCDVIPLQVLWKHNTRGRDFLQDGVHLSRVDTAVLARSFIISALGMTEKQDLTAGHRSGNHRQHAYKG